MLSSPATFATAKRLGQPRDQQAGNEPTVNHGSALESQSNFVGMNLETNNGRVSEEQRNILLEEYNKYRSLTARGLTPGSPMAKDMHKLVWSESLAEEAAQWASTCLDGAHDCNAGTETIAGAGIRVSQ